MQFIDRLVDDPTVLQRQLPTIQGVQHYMQHDKEMDVRAFMLDADELCQSAIGKDDSDQLNELPMKTSLSMRTRRGVSPSEPRQS